MAVPAWGPIEAPHTPGSVVGPDGEMLTCGPTDAAALVSCSLKLTQTAQYRAIRLESRYAEIAPALPGLETEVTYTVEDTGRMFVDVRCYGGPDRPELPLLGLRFATPKPLKAVEWLGLSGETYPGRKKGGVYGWHREIPHVPAYLVPQECGCHADTCAAILRGAGKARLTLEAEGGPFAFSALPYTPQQLEQAAHREELPVPVRTVVTLYGAMRGVGGINSWGADVEEPYRVKADEDIVFSFAVRLNGQQLQPQQL